jgi:hypothetical protein
MRITWDSFVTGTDDRLKLLIHMQRWLSNYFEELKAFFVLNSINNNII